MMGNADFGAKSSFVCKTSISHGKISFSLEVPLKFWRNETLFMSQRIDSLLLFTNHQTLQ